MWCFQQHNLGHLCRYIQSSWRKIQAIPVKIGGEFEFRVKSVLHSKAVKNRHRPQAIFLGMNINVCICCRFGFARYFTTEAAEKAKSTLHETELTDFGTKVIVHLLLC